jgi:hypothetical protein
MNKPAPLPNGALSDRTGAGGLDNAKRAQAAPSPHNGACDFYEIVFAGYARVVSGHKRPREKRPALRARKVAFTAHAVERAVQHIKFVWSVDPAC